MFLSTVEKQLDAKRRIVLPQDFRAAATGPFDGIFCFPSIEADCIEGGGQALFDAYDALIEELAFGHPLRTALETTVFGSLFKLSYDTAGRITLPEALCDQYGLTDQVAVVGLKTRFQIWSLPAYRAHLARMVVVAREGLPAFRTLQRSGGAGS